MKVRNNFAILRNLRNILEIGVSQKYMDKLKKCFNDDSWGKSKILPFRYISAARYVPSFEPQLEQALFESLAEKPKIKGKVIVLVDVSGSMDVNLSDRSEVLRIDVGCGLAMMLREVCDCKIFSFSEYIKEIPPRHGFALRDAINNSQSHSSTYLGKAVKIVSRLEHDILIVISDEQSHDVVPDPGKKGYMINVASYQRGVGYGKWTHLDGWSDSIVDWITEYETAEWC